MSTAAIIIAGHTREYKHYLTELTYLKKKFNADVFISSYIEKGTGVRFWQGQPSIGDVLTNTELKEINQTLGTKLSIFSSDISLPLSISKHTFQNKLVSVPGTYKMLYKIWEANNLKLKFEKENNFKYDIVFRTRFDLKYKNVDLTGFKAGSIFGARADIRKYATDTFFVCDSYTMDKIVDLYNSFGTKVLPENYYNCEHMLTEWITGIGYKINFGGIDLRLRDKKFN